MSCVKKYNMGQIKLDLPYSYYIYELPLLSFGDVQHTVNLSLVFNRERYENGNNFFNLATGYKLNLQKKLNIVGDDIGYMEENGKIIPLTRFGDVYTFDDDSQRILRRTVVTGPLPDPGEGFTPITPAVYYNYTVEYPDFSKEIYNSDGYITAVYDKYNSDDACLAYTYANNKLTVIAYRSNKKIIIGYPEDSITVQYTNNGSVVSTTSMEFNNGGGSIEHYSGVVYNLSLNGMDFTATAANIGASTPIYFKKIEYATDTITVSEGEGDPNSTEETGQTTINSTEYKFPYYFLGEFIDAYQIDITDKHGVKARNQYINERVAYSYEISNSGPTFNSETGQYAGRYLGKVTVSRTENKIGAGTIDHADGETIADINQNNAATVNVATIKDQGSGGYYIFSGWVKSSETTNYVIYIDGKRYDLGFGRFIREQWNFFSIGFQTSSLNIDIHAEAQSTAVEFKDLRVSYHKTHEQIRNTYQPLYSECVLINKDEDFNTNTEKGTVVTTKMFSHIIGTAEDTDFISESDLLRYKINKKKGINSGEFYYNRCKNVITGVTDLTVDINDDGNLVSLDQFDVGKKQFKNYKECIAHVKVNNNNFIVTEYSKDENMWTPYRTQTLDNNLDLVSSTTDGVTTNYNRNASGLITSETIVSGNDIPTITRSTTYDDALTKIVSTTDEFGTKTEYTIDDTWGVVTGITVKSANDVVQSAVADTFDDDKCALLSRQFINSTDPRTTQFEYESGNLTRLTHNGITFGFGYENGKLASVSKGASVIEEHEHTDTTLDSYYPTQSTAIYSVLSDFDKYGRVTKIDGVVENVYDIAPKYDANGDLISLGAYSSALLATSKDLTKNQTSKYHYDEKSRVEKIETENASGTLAAEESFAYDNADRLTSDTFKYSLSPTEKSVSHSIGYTKPDTHPLADNEVSTYTYKVNNVEKIKTTSYYDGLKRYSRKTYTIGDKVITKDFGYTKTRPTVLTERMGSTMFGGSSYEYDVLGRISKYIFGGYIISYEYDSYGQLVRENNQALDKTFVYEYNGIGNILNVKTYAHTPQGTAISGNPTKIDSLTHADAAHPDRLTKLGYKNITYNSMGCPITYGSKYLDWENGKLKKYYDEEDPYGSLSSESVEFGYNAYGQRVLKDYVYNPGDDYSDDFLIGSTSEYTYDNSGRLIRELITESFTMSSSVEKELMFLYDETGIIGVIYNDGVFAPQTYYYQRNLMGDVIGIYNTIGTKIVTYAYDAFGNCTITQGSGQEIAKINPIRYRGYYFDRETGLYYLNARYYNPEWRRFISPDDTAYLDPENVNGLNLYCYCGNDPVNFADPSGMFAIASFLIGLGIAAAIGAGVGAASYAVGQLIDYAVTGDFEWSWGGFAGSIVGGALGGMAAYSFALLKLSMVGVFVSGFATTAMTMIGENIANDAYYTTKEILSQSLIDGVAAIISSKVMKKIKIKPINSGRGSYSAISQQIYTKITNGTITRVSAKTLGKMFVSEFYEGIFGMLLN